MTVMRDVVAGYYESVRTMACFTLVGFLALLATFDENNKEGWGVEKRPCIVAWTASECMMHDHVVVAVIAGDICGGVVGSVGKW